MSCVRRDIMAHQLAAAAFEQSSERFRASIPATIFPGELSNVLNIKLWGEIYWNTLPIGERRPYSIIANLKRSSSGNSSYLNGFRMDYDLPQNVDLSPYGRFSFKIIHLYKKFTKLYLDNGCKIPANLRGRL